jgi:hypothetical protein
MEERVWTLECTPKSKCYWPAWSGLFWNFCLGRTPTVMLCLGLTMLSQPICLFYS